MAAPEPSALIPVTLLTGFLGSGKTTVLNHVLKQPDMAATAVIVTKRFKFMISLPMLASKMHCKTLYRTK